MTSSPDQPTSEILQGKRLAFVGRLASMARRDAATLVRRHGAVVTDSPDPTVDMVVVGEEGLPLLPAGDQEDLLDGATRRAAEEGTLEIVTETQLWHRLGMVDMDQDVHRLYTPAMLAGLLDVPVAVIRRWHRRGLICPVREVRRLPYFDFQEVATARRLAELLAAGMSPQAIEKKLGELARFLPGVDRPLAQLSVIVRGKEILLRQGDGLVDAGGQLRFDFEASEGADAVAPGGAPGDAETVLPIEQQGAGDAPPAATPEAMLGMAAELEEQGQLPEATEMVRAALAAAGSSPVVCFQLAELLYRQGDLAAARERYYMAVELDEDYVEARANLGCVLAETGQGELAVAAFEGALAYHPDYADAHYHMARTLDELDRREESELHWRSFLALAPDSPWAEEARGRLGGQL